MGRGGKIIGTAAMLSVAACGGEQGKLEIRSTATPLAAGQRPVPFRIAEAAGQFALGNVALALEAFRIALREDPKSIEAMMGVAACYDRMTRFDLSRRHYEAALAVAPGDPRLLTAFAESLELQGLRTEAASVRAEVQERLALASANAAPLPAPVAAAPPAARPAPITPAPAIAKVAVAQAQSQPRVASVEPVRAAPVVPKPSPEPSRQLAAMPHAPIPAPAARPAATPPIGRSVTVALPPARPATQALPAGPVASVALKAPAPLDVPQPRALPTPAVQPAVTLALRPSVTQAPRALPASETVTVTLPPAASAVAAPVAAAPVAATPVAASPEKAVAQAERPTSAIAKQADAAKSGPRLERTSPREVALITVAAPQWRALTVSRTPRSATVRFVPLRQASLRLSGVRLLNAARVNRLAARTRSYLVRRGWSPMTIGNAPTARAHSIIYYPPHRRRTAETLAAQFGFTIAQRPGSRHITVLLGRDAARVAALRAT